MKFLFVILALLLAPKECDQKKSVEDTGKTEFVNNQDTATQQQECTIQYTAITRGSYKEVIIDGKTISIKNDRNSEPVVKDCNDELWKNIMQKVDSIDVKSLSSLVAPTEKRFYDGAAHANIKITIDEKTYESQEFDHGFPPEEIKILCDKILDISSNDKKE